MMSCIKAENSKCKKVCVPQHTVCVENKIIIPNAIKKEIHKFSEKKQAIDFLITLNDPEYHLFGTDIILNNGAKNFIVTKYDHIYYLSSHYQTCLYEFYGSESNVKLHIDIDCKEENFNNMTCEEALDYYINETLDFLYESIFPKLKITKETPSYIILKSQNSKNKGSAHIIFTNIIFDNIYSIKYLFCEHAKNCNLLTLKIIDPAIYKDGCFRMYMSSKLGKNNELVYYKSHNYNFIDDKTLFLDSTVCNITDNFEIFTHADNKINNVTNHKPSNKKISNISSKQELKKTKIFSNMTIDELSKLINIINKKRADDYHDWITIGLIIYKYNNSKQSFNIWKNFSSQSLKFNENDCIYKWNSFSTSYLKLTIGTLKYYARTDNEDEYNKLDIFTVDSPIFQTYNIHKQYFLTTPPNENVHKLPNNLIRNLNVDLFEIFDKWYNGMQKVLAIVGACGTGKTLSIHSILKEYKPKTILFISYRQSLSYNLAGNFKDFNIKNYLDGNNYDSPKFICQIDSLHKLLNYNIFEDCYNVPKYDLVVLDEAEAILNHFGSTTLKNKSSIFNIMTSILNKCGKVLALDGDFHNRCYSYLQTINDKNYNTNCDENFTVIQNTYVPVTNNWKFTNDEIGFDKKVFNDVKNGLKIFIVAMSSEKALKYEEELTKQNISVILHYSKSDDEKKKKLIDVNVLWINYQVVIITPTVEAGVDFFTKYFDKMYIILSSKSTTQRGLYQMTNRSRYIKDNQIDVFLNGIPYKENINSYCFSEINDSVDLTLNNHFGNFDDLIVNDDGNLVHKNSAYIKVCKYNKLEELSKNSCYFIPKLLHILKQKGQTFQFDKSICKKSKNIISITKENIINARNIDDFEYKQLLKNQALLDADTNDKYAIEKHTYKKQWKVDTIDDEFLKKAYRKTHVLFNNLAINGNLLKSYYTIDNDYFDIDLIVKKQKLDTVNELLKELKFKDENNNFNHITHTKDDFEKAKDNAIKKCKLFNDTKILILFGLNKKIFASNKSFMGFTNSILKEYGIELKIKRETERKDKKTFKNSFYFINQFMCT